MEAGSPPLYSLVCALSSEQPPTQTRIRTLAHAYVHAHHIHAHAYAHARAQAHTFLHTQAHGHINTHTFTPTLLGHFSKLFFREWARVHVGQQRAV